MTSYINALGRLYIHKETEHKQLIDQRTAYLSAKCHIQGNPQTCPLTATQNSRHSFWSDPSECVISSGGPTYFEYTLSYTVLVLW